MQPPIELPEGAKQALRDWCHRYRDTGFRDMADYGQELWDRMLRSIAACDCGTAPTEKKLARMAGDACVYVYEYDSALGVHRELQPITWNGLRPTRTLRFCAAPAQSCGAPDATDAYVAQRMSQALADVYITILGGDEEPDDKSLNAIERVQTAAQTLRLEVDLYRAQRAKHTAEQADAPQKLCSICHGYGRYQDGDSGTESDGYAPNIVECECAPEERFPNPAEQADEAELLQIVRCRPDLLLLHIEQDTAYDAELLARVFELAKRRASDLLAARAKDSK